MKGEENDFKRYECLLSAANQIEHEQLAACSMHVPTTMLGIKNHKTMHYVIMYAKYKIHIIICKQCIVLQFEFFFFWKKQRSMDIK